MSGNDDRRLLAQSAFETDSDTSDIDIPSNLQCAACLGRHQVAVRFKLCPHAACIRCLKGIFKAKFEGKLHGEYPPVHIDCHLCRAKVEHFGVLNKGPLSNEGTVVLGGVAFGISEWIPLLKWMSDVDETVLISFKINYLKRKYRISVRRLAGRWEVKDQGTVVALSGEEIRELIRLRKMKT
ncbi:uncharacterized protein H6S33_001885 [Morchella sextelata]|uniref:uncharacterized protein n=1 Tax=Morchella sextelata TaxID=1174677 RepID=UPI001D046794|nr:uncharacterized protein H6S33_001885 [Morchella sextelata]KAH0608751.1 hypothetical protein H6S33_001885 [Morchella sextelata]